MNTVSGKTPGKKNGPVLDDALGLMNPAERTLVVPPRRRKVAFVTPAACALLKSLDDFIEQHGEERLTIDTREGPREVLLGQVGHEFPSPNWGVPLERDRKRLPLPQLWEAWWQQRPKRTHDRDGLELLRAAAWLDIDNHDLKRWQKLGKRSSGLRAAVEALTGGGEQVELRHVSVVVDLLGWLRRLHPAENVVDFLLDAVETSFALVPEDELQRELNPKNKEEEWRELEPFEKWLGLLEAEWGRSHSRWTKDQVVRYWQLHHWRDRPLPGIPRRRPDLDVLLAAYEAGAANQHDLLDELLGPRAEEGYHYARDFASLQELTAPRPPEILQRRPKLRQLVERCRDRLLEIELARGKLPTNATDAVLCLGALEGLDTLVRLLRALAGKAFDRKRGQDSQRKGTVIGHLIHITHPLPADTREAFADQMKELVKEKLLTEERVLELAFLAPQWAAHVEHFLGWEGLREGLLWFLAHTPSARHRVEKEDAFEEDFDEAFEQEEPAGSEKDKERPWTKLLRERTPLTQQELNEGAADVAWFARTYAAVGSKRWRLLAEASKFGCRDNGYMKAVRLGEVLRGKGSKRRLTHGVKAPGTSRA